MSVMDILRELGRSMISATTSTALLSSSSYTNGADQLLSSSSEQIEISLLPSDAKTSNDAHLCILSILVSDRDVPLIFLRVCKEFAPQQIGKLMSKWKTVISELALNYEGRNILIDLIMEAVDGLISFPSNSHFQSQSEFCNSTHRDGKSRQDLVFRLAIFVPSLSQMLIHWDKDRSTDNLLAKLKSLVSLPEDYVGDAEDVCKFHVIENVLVSLTAAVNSVCQSIQDRHTIVILDKSAIKSNGQLSVDHGNEKNGDEKNRDENGNNGNEKRSNQHSVVCLSIFMGLVPSLGDTVRKLSALRDTDVPILLKDGAKNVRSCAFQFMIELAKDIKVFCTEGQEMTDQKSEAQRIELMSLLIMIPVMIHRSIVSGGYEIPIEIQRELGGFLLALSQNDTETFRTSLAKLSSPSLDDLPIRGSIETLMRAHITGQRNTAIPRSQHESPSQNSKIELKMKF